MLTRKKTSPERVESVYRPISPFLILADCSLMAGASLGLCFYSAGLFYEPVANGLSLSIGQTSLMTTYFLVFMALMTLMMPWLLRHIPLRYLTGAGMALSAGATLLMAFSFGSIWLYICASLQGIGCALVGLVTVTTIINEWFYSRNSLVTSFVLACPAIAAACFSPVFGLSVAALGWRMSYVLMAVIIMLMILPSVLRPFSVAPSHMNQQPYGIKDAEVIDQKKGKSSRKQIFAGLAFIGILASALIALPLLFSSYVSSVQLPVLIASQMLSLAMIGSIVFKIAGGWIADKLDAFAATGILDVIVLIATGGFLLSIYFPSETALKVLSVLMGAVFALAELCLPLLIKNRFGRLRYTSIYALIYFLSLLTTAISIAVVGRMVDVFKSYVWIEVIALVMEAFIAGLVWYMIKETAPVIHHAIEKKVLHKQTAATGILNEQNPAHPHPQQDETAAPVLSEIVNDTDEEDDANNRESKPVSLHESHPAEYIVQDETEEDQPSFFDPVKKGTGTAESTGKKPEVNLQFETEEENLEAEGKDKAENGKPSEVSPDSALPSSGKKADFSSES